MFEDDQKVAEGSTGEEPRRRQGVVAGSDKALLKIGGTFFNVAGPTSAVLQAQQNFLQARNIEEQIRSRTEIRKAELHARTELIKAVLRSTLLGAGGATCWKVLTIVAAHVH